MLFNAGHLSNLALQRSAFPFREELSGKRILLSNEIENFLEVRKGNFSGEDEKDFIVRYKAHELLPFSESFFVREFVRYDFREEWNNRGFGKIATQQDDPFACSQKYFLNDHAEVFAEVLDRRTGEKVSDYAALIRREGEIYLWFNRSVGPIDGYDWVIVEEFLSSDHLKAEFSLPCVAEIPYGYSAAITMRIDCDEAVASGRPLFELYKKRDMPFSMAIKTQQDLSADDRLLIRDVLAAKGSVVGHSHTHAPNWGGSRDSAAWEVRESHKVLRSLGIEGINYDYVVSPFHQNPFSSILGLSDAGIRGFVGGIACNDPEYLMARAGIVPGVPGIISHSQQCMFHGDTYRQAQNSIQGYTDAFVQSIETRTFFGFLDHPFSKYWYGWSNEDERLSAHADFLDFVLSSGALWKANLVDALRFLEMKSGVEIRRNGHSFRASLPFNERFVGLPSVRVDLNNISYELNLGDQIDIA